MRHPEQALTWRRGAWLSLAALVLLVLSLLPFMGSSTELVRMRNALVLGETAGVDFNWTPEQTPAGFLDERGPASPLYAEQARRLGLQSLPSDWDRVLVISRHLLGSHPTLYGGAVQSDLDTTYHQIVEEGKGYCGDFVRVFTGLALASGMSVRPWAFSFDGFGGDGHIFLEIWNRELKRWQLVDIFNNYYFLDARGTPLSALEFRQALKTAPASLQLKPLFASARPGYVVEDKAWKYYERGLTQWYAVWGNNVFSYDRAVLGHRLTPLSRSMEQLNAIAQGLYPPLLLLDDPGSHAEAEAMWRLRTHLRVVAGLGLLCLLAFAVCVLKHQQLSRRAA
nr:transglutaminase domain-containing protein [uncultured Roseateles sp.]